MVFELRINLVWDKGRAVMWLLRAKNVDPSDPNVSCYEDVQSSLSDSTRLHWR